MSGSAAEPSEDGAARPLTRSEILAKLGVVPTFIVLNGDNNAVSMRDSVNGGETCYWHTDPAEAKAQLDATKRNSPEVPGLHLGQSTLGVAYANGAKWTSAQHAGEARMGTAPGYEAPTLRHRLIIERGMSEEMPVYLCAKLQTPVKVPVFLDRVDLASEWVRSGRTKEEFKPDVDLTVMDLRMLVHQMETTDVFAWSAVCFVPPSRGERVARQATARLAKAAEDGDEPPPLT